MARISAAVDATKKEERERKQMMGMEDGVVERRVKEGQWMDREDDDWESEGVSDVNKPTYTHNTTLRQSNTKYKTKLKNKIVSICMNETSNNICEGILTQEPHDCIKPGMSNSVPTKVHWKLILPGLSHGWGKIITAYFY
jgi:hypothetical protein